MPMASAPVKASPVPGVSTPQWIPGRLAGLTTISVHVDDRSPITTRNVVIHFMLTVSVKLQEDS
jgi:hypothetical protein